jgi:hypothetical protein
MDTNTDTKIWAKENLLWTQLLGVFERFFFTKWTPKRRVIMSIRDEVKKGVMDANYQTPVTTWAGGLFYIEIFFFACVIGFYLNSFGAFLMVFIAVGIFFGQSAFYGLLALSTGISISVFIGVLTGTDKTECHTLFYALYLAAGALLSSGIVNSILYILQDY